MSGFNKAIVAGRLGKDPEVRQLSTGKSVANFTLATSDTWKDKTTGEKKEDTQWHNCVVYGALADIVAKYVHKGDLILIEGKLKTRSWEKEGVTRYTTEIHADQMTMLGSKNGSSTPAGASDRSEPTEQQASTSSGASDDLPF